ncbi:hypothetical protein SAY86_014529 [Trapa natans]|uniref:ASCH domain-containing protein n=1 Tax=Trapa natans TaxID=22666 RepID=A0AAN7KWM8_TRANT|nr:hypothetical protein SAY86_014529 [Trapa natans]
MMPFSDGHKTIEGRCATGDYNRIGTGAFLLVNKCLVLEVKDIRTYSSFSEMLEAECLSKVLPGVNSVEEGVQIYRRFYTEEKEMRNGVLAIDILRSFPQPYISLSQILSELGYSGVQSLLDLVCTAETISDMLPPPRFVLLSAFQQPHNPSVKGITLTDGARALAKHFGGSSRRPGATLMATENDSEQQTQGEDLASNHSFYNA